jgi:hypothetical protein
MAEKSPLDTDFQDILDSLPKVNPDSVTSNPDNRRQSERIQGSPVQVILNSFLQKIENGKNEKAKNILAMTVIPNVWTFCNLHYTKNQVELNENESQIPILERVKLIFKATSLWKYYVSTDKFHFRADDNGKTESNKKSSSVSKGDQKEKEGIEISSHSIDKLSTSPKIRAFRFEGANNPYAAEVIITPENDVTKIKSWYSQTQNLETEKETLQAIERLIHQLWINVRHIWYSVFKALLENGSLPPHLLALPTISQQLLNNSGFYQDELAENKERIAELYKLLTSYKTNSGDKTTNYISTELKRLYQNFSAFFTSLKIRIQKQELFEKSEREKVLKFVDETISMAGLFTSTNKESFNAFILPSLYTTKLEECYIDYLSMHQECETRQDFKTHFGWLGNDKILWNSDSNSEKYHEPFNFDSLILNSVILKAWLSSKPWGNSIDSNKFLNFQLGTKIQWTHVSVKKDIEGEKVCFDLTNRFSFWPNYTNVFFNWPFFQTSLRKEGAQIFDTLSQLRQKINMKLQDATSNYIRHRATKTLRLHRFNINSLCCPDSSFSSDLSSSSPSSSSSNISKSFISPKIRGKTSNEIISVPVKQKGHGGIIMVYTQGGRDKIYVVRQENEMFIHFDLETLRNPDDYNVVVYDEESKTRQTKTKQPQKFIKNYLHIIFPKYLIINNIIMQNNIIVVELSFTGVDDDQLKLLTSNHLNSKLEHLSYQSISLIGVFKINPETFGKPNKEQVLTPTKSGFAGIYFSFYDVSSIFFSSEQLPVSNEREEFTSSTSSSTTTAPTSSTSSSSSTETHNHLPIDPTNPWYREDENALNNLFIFQGGFYVYEINLVTFAWRLACRPIFPKSLAGTTRESLSRYSVVKMFGSYLVFLNTNASTIGITPMRPRLLMEKDQLKKGAIERTIKRQILSMPKLETIFKDYKPAPSSLSEAEGINQIDWSKEPPPNAVDVTLLGSLLAVGMSDGRVVLIDLHLPADETRPFSVLQPLQKLPTSDYVMTFYNKMSSIFFSSPWCLDFFTDAGDSITYKINPPSDKL